MANEQNIHLLYKKLGETPYEAILRYKKEHPEYTETSMTYAGRLDPMAEGLLLVLSGEEVFEKEKYLDLPKTYEFEILWGFETDTLDVLGLVSEDSFSTYPSQGTDIFLLKNSSSLAKTPRGFSPLASLGPSQDMISTNLRESFGRFEQTYPVYSSRPVNGKSLFQWAREGRIGEIDIPKHEVELYEAEYLDRKIISKVDLLNNIKDKVSLVKGDFRQQEIIEKWEDVFGENDSSEFVVDKIKVVVSSGFYIRQFISDLALKLDTKAIAFHIKRTKVGEFIIS